MKQFTLSFSFSFILLCCISVNQIFAASDKSESISDTLKQISSDVTVTNDFIGTINGGISKNISNLSLISFDIEYKPKLWRSFTFYTHMLKTFGKPASEEFIGDLQKVSNIEGKSTRLLYEAWISKSFKDLNIKAGLHDLNSVFMISDFGCDFTNGSFGVMPTLSLNQLASIFPVTTLGIIISYEKPIMDAHLGFYNLNHEFINETSFNFRNHFYHLGHLIIGELAFKHRFSNDLAGKYTVGFYHENSHPLSDAIFTFNPEIQSQGLYSMMDQNLYKTPKSELNSFFQFSYDNGESHKARSYFGGGLVWSHGMKNNRKLSFGLGVASLQFSKQFLDSTNLKPHETTIELKSCYQFNQFFTINPSLQYVVYPSGFDMNALVGIIRFVFQADYSR